MNKIPWGPIRSILTANFSFGSIKEIVGYADIDMSKLSHLEQKSQGGASKSQLLSAIDAQIGNMEENSSGVVASIVCEEMLRRNPDLISELERVLSRVGWKFSGTVLLPIEIFDVSELKEIPEIAHQDIQKGSIYQEFGLGDPNKSSFQERIKKSINAIGAKDRLQNELRDIGWGDSDINPLSSNLDGSLNQAAFVMQKLRSNMGDVHGSKPVVSALIYDSIKWSLLLLRVLVTRESL
ncbi:hypothetical protein LCGC14_2633320 [marine sediment metagenome]|uniref:Uncharacterized protein n=1 Tax=marine sediment metagenome TaxID=412755 RepID=A0A0F9CS54_9ZZZZ